jgi:hypothetical protein
MKHGTAERAHTHHVCAVCRAVHRPQNKFSEKQKQERSRNAAPSHLLAARACAATLEKRGDTDERGCRESNPAEAPRASFLFYSETVHYVIY